MVINLRTKITYPQKMDIGGVKISLMTLTVHALGGTAAALIFRKNPVLAFIAAFFSHFVLDAIPHWDLGHMLESFQKPRNNSTEVRITFNRKFLADLLKIGADFSLGTIVSLGATELFQSHYLFISLIGIAGGVLPDALKFVYFVFPKSLVRYLQKFHSRIHLREKWGYNPLLGILAQIAIGIILFAIIKEL